MKVIAGVLTDNDMQITISGASGDVLFTWQSSIPDDFNNT
jgi:hypothetical protein